MNQTTVLPQSRNMWQYWQNPWQRHGYVFRNSFLHLFLSVTSSMLACAVEKNRLSSFSSKHCTSQVPLVTICKDHSSHSCNYFWQWDIYSIPNNNPQFPCPTNIINYSLLLQLTLHYTRHWYVSRPKMYPFILHTWAISTSPKDSKYSRSCCSVVFQGKPSTIRSEHFNFVSMRFVFAVEFSKWSSDLRLFSAKK